MTLLVMGSQGIDVLVDCVLDDSGFGVPFLFSLFFADVAVVMLVPVMQGQSIGIVKLLVIAKFAIEMIRFLMFMVLVPSEKLLFEEQDWLVFHTELTMMHMMHFV
jgi:hypothetical protein